jgi:hypothetical protein
MSGAAGESKAVDEAAARAAAETQAKTKGFILTILIKYQFPAAKAKEFVAEKSLEQLFGYDKADWKEFLLVRKVSEERAPDLAADLWKDLQKLIRESSLLQTRRSLFLLSVCLSQAEGGRKPRCGFALSSSASRISPPKAFTLGCSQCTQQNSFSRSPSCVFVCRRRE